MIDGKIDGWRGRGKRLVMLDDLKMGEKNYRTLKQRGQYRQK